jgi:two-component system cell cycle response regulator
MPSQILIVDPVVTSRIVMKVRLTEALYEVRAAGSVHEAAERIAAAMPDLVILDLGDDPAEGMRFCRDLREAPATAALPVIALGRLDWPDDRLAALAAGADDVFAKPLHEGLLTARIRSMLRVRAAAADLAPPPGAARLLGLADGASRFLGPGQTALVVPQTPVGLLRAQAVRGNLPGGVRVVSPQAALGPGGAGRNIDLFVIDATPMDEDRFAEDVLRLIPELRARSDSRQAGQLVILPQRAEGMAAMALDLGADDIVRHDVSLAELGFRSRRLLARKRRHDCLRATFQDGLRAAMTDPLTGLYNRRYAEPHLRGLALSAREGGPGFAMLVLDIDHFKRINDRFGHAAGDAVLREVARRLSDALRPEDLVARIGGEEFLIALPGHDARRACMIAERLCALIEETHFAIPGRRTPVQVTLSIGVALGGTGGDEAIESIVGRADAALYAAKSAGRNTVSLSAA